MAHPEMVTEKGLKVPRSSLRKKLDLKKTEINNITRCGLWERKECFRVRLHLNSPFVAFMSGMTSPIWGWFYYEMKTVNIKIVHKLKWVITRQPALRGMCSFSCRGCLCWHCRQLGSAKDDPPVGPLFHRTDQLFDETGWTSLLGRALLSYQVRVFLLKEAD